MATKIFCDMCGVEFEKKHNGLNSNKCTIKGEKHYAFLIVNVYLGERNQIADICDDCIIEIFRQTVFNKTSTKKD